MAQLPADVLAARTRLAAAYRMERDLHRLVHEALMRWLDTGEVQAAPSPELREARLNAFRHLRLMEHELGEMLLSGTISRPAPL